MTWVHWLFLTLAGMIALAAIVWTGLYLIIKDVHKTGRKRKT